MKMNVWAALLSTTIVMSLAGHGTAKANVVDYSIAGSYSGGTLSGTLTFDTTTGAVTSATIDASGDGTFSGTDPFQQPIAGTDLLVNLSGGGPRGLGLVIDSISSLSAGQTSSIAAFSGFTAAPFDNGSFSGTLTISSAVPEPSTWVMLILGFFGLGFLAHRRQNRPSLSAA
jgi:hypothetical protein